jgi:hypothetical protein
MRHPPLLSSRGAKSRDLRFSQSPTESLSRTKCSWACSRPKKMKLARTNIEWVAQVSLLRPGFLLNVWFSSIFDRTRRSGGTCCFFRRYATFVCAVEIRLLTRPFDVVSPYVVECGRRPGLPAIHANPVQCGRTLQQHSNISFLISIRPRCLAAFRSGGQCRYTQELNRLALPLLPHRVPMSALIV